MVLKMEMEGKNIKNTNKKDHPYHKKIDLPKLQFNKIMMNLLLNFLDH
jgi:hypothetical protein